MSRCATANTWGVLGAAPFSSFGDKATEGMQYCAMMVTAGTRR
jgi:hypothetical protein